MHQAIDRIERALGSDAQLVVVGGSIRDWLLGRNHEDWDLATALMPQEVTVRAKAAGIKVIPTGIKHGTITLIVKGQAVEITTFRGDGIYLDGRHPEAVTLGVSLEQDLARRDFTINAMALPVSALKDPNWLDKLIDPHGGHQDLNNRIIRTVGDPLSRFQEDGLRVLRACRFAATLDFEVDLRTLEAIPMCLNVASKVAIERVFTELTKLLCGSKPELGLNILAVTGLLKLWLPELYPMLNRMQTNCSSRTIWEHTIAVVRRVMPTVDLRWAALLHDAGKLVAEITDINIEPTYCQYGKASVILAKDILVRMHASRMLINQVTALMRNNNLINNCNDESCRCFIKQLYADHLTIDNWSSLCLADKIESSEDSIVIDQFLSTHNTIVQRLKLIVAKHPPLFIQDLAIDGSMIMQIAQQKGGPWIKTLKNTLLETVLEDPTANTVATLTNLTQQWLNKNHLG